MANFNVEVLEIIKKYAAIDPDSGPSRQAYAKFVEEKSPSEVRWWTKDTIAIVTGGNKGLGLEIVRQIAKEGITTVLTARDKKRGEDAVNALKAEGLENVIYHELDVTDSKSAASLAAWAQKTFGGVDILVCNAGVSPQSENPYENAKLALGTNYSGQKTVVSEFLPILKPSRAGARIIFLSSELGQLQALKSDKLKTELSNVDGLTFERLDSVDESFLDAAKEGKVDDWAIGFSQPYAVSKVLLNAYGRLLAKSLSDRPDGKKVYVNLASPGLTFTDMNPTFEKIARTVQHGADTAVWLALFPSGGPNGHFLRDRADYPW